MISILYFLLPDHNGLPTISHSYLPGPDHFPPVLFLPALIRLGIPLLPGCLLLFPGLLPLFPFLVALLALEQFGLVFHAFPLDVTQLLTEPAPQAVLARVSIISLAEVFSFGRGGDLLESVAHWTVLGANGFPFQVGPHAIHELADL